MPLIKIDIIRGRSQDELRVLLDACHEAMVEAFSVPYSDRYQCVTQHEEGELVLHDTGLEFTRTHKVVLMTVVSRPRTDAQKQQFYKLTAERLASRTGLAASDLVIAIVENQDASWSFGNGRAQFLTGELE